MTLSDLCIRRPVFATVMSLIVVLLGIMAYARLPVREYPNIDAPVVSVRSVYRGASSEVVESQVTQPLEDSLAGIEGIKTMRSVSREEVSQITITFYLERDPDAAASDVRDRVARVRGALPREAEEPIISKVEADASAIIWLGFFSDRHTPLEITDFADRYVRDRLQSLNGVASIIIGGERRYAMRIWLDRARLAAYGLTPQDVEEALLTRNVEIPAGRIESSERELTVLAETDLRSAEEFNALIIRDSDGVPVRLRDLGRAELGAEDERNAVRVNGKPAVGLGVVKQATANTLEVARQVRAEIPAIESSLPPGMELRIAFDSSRFIERSIAEVFKTLWEALALVMLVTFAFLRSLRATLIPFVAIPVSLIGAFIFIYALGFTVNVLTLLALVLAIGLVVDDAIVVLENIYRRIERGLRPMPAALEGSREIAFAVVAMTLTLATVFAPLAYLSGNTGRLFGEFALAVSSAVLVSGFVALTLTPMMCAKVLTTGRHGRVYTRTEGLSRWLIAGYRRALAAALDLRWLIVLLGLAVAGLSYGTFLSLKSELAPVEDRATIIGVINAPDGATMRYTDRYARRIEAMLARIPEVYGYFMVVAPGIDRPNPVNLALTFISLKPWEQRHRTQMDVTNELLPRLMDLPGVMAFANNPASLGGGGFRSQPVQLVVQGNSYPELQDYIDRLMEQARRYPGLVNLDTDLKLNKPQLRVSVDRDKAADLGVEVADIGHTLETLLGGRQVTRFKRQGEQYDVIVKLEDSARRTPADLTSIYLRGAGNTLVQLDNLARVQETVAPKELNHFNRLRAAILSASLAPGQSLGEAIAFLESTAAKVLPPAARIDFEGQSREFRESGRGLYLTFALALVFIYLVLAAQFESFIDPLIILLTVPLAVTGALAALKLSGNTLNVYSQIGLVMLVGLITKNGILIVEFANRLQRSGQGLREAVIEAAGLRLRPILMTTAAMVLGALPLALAAGAGAESREPIGWVIVGGLAFGTLLTLFVIPSVYTLLGRKPQSPTPA
ncbi:MAG: efflux RND transporter permease subunit [Gammaproteobacteria bacterium]